MEYLVATGAIIHPETRQPIVKIGDIIPILALPHYSRVYGIDAVEGIWCPNAQVALDMQPFAKPH